MVLGKGNTHRRCKIDKKKEKFEMEEFSKSLEENKKEPETLKGTLHIEHINIGSKSECDAAFLYLQNSGVEKVKLKFKDSPLFSVQEFLPYKELFVECKGEIDSITGTFIIDEINRSEI